MSIRKKHPKHPALRAVPRIDASTVTVEEVTELYDSLATRDAIHRVAESHTERSPKDEFVDFVTLNIEELRGDMCRALLRRAVQLLKAGDDPNWQAHSMEQLRFSSPCMWEGMAEGGDQILVWYANHILKVWVDDDLVYYTDLAAAAKPDTITIDELIKNIAHVVLIPENCSVVHLALAPKKSGIKPQIDPDF